MIQQAIEAELPALLERCESIMACVPVRNGYMSDCGVAITAGSIALQVPKDRDRSGLGVKVNSSIVPPRVRMTPRRLSSNSASGRSASGVPRPCSEVLSAKLERD